MGEALLKPMEIEVADGPSREALIEALRSVYDPEIPVNIYDLGLIYKLEHDEEGKVLVEMTLTSPACPVAGILPQQVGDAIDAVPGVKDATIRLVWDPPWNQDMIPDETKLELGLL